MTEETQKLLTVLVRLLNLVSGTILTHHLDIIGITDFTGLDIFTAVKSILNKYEISFENVLNFTLDTCNVMKGARKGVIAHMYTCVMAIFACAIILSVFHENTEMT